MYNGFKMYFAMQINFKIQRAGTTILIFRVRCQFANVWRHCGGEGGSINVCIVQLLWKSCIGFKIYFATQINFIVKIVVGYILLSKNKMGTKVNYRPHNL